MDLPQNAAGELQLDAALLRDLIAVLASEPHFSTADAFAHAFFSNDPDWTKLSQVLSEPVEALRSRVERLKPLSHSGSSVCRVEERSVRINK